MSCCCTNKLFLCQVGTCLTDVIKWGQLATAGGIHKLKVEFLGQVYSIEKQFDVDDELSFPTNPLNENYTFVGELYGPDGNKMDFVKDSVHFDCVQFETVIVNSITND